MATNYFTRKPMVSFILLVVCGLGLHSSTSAEEKEQETPNVNSQGEAFTSMNVEMLKAYRNERYADVAESLTLSELSEEHQELIANAMAKAYLGVPVGSFTETSIQGLDDEQEPATTKNWEVTDTGQLEGESDSTVSGLYSLSPFVALPQAPFVPETGKLVEESDTTAKFVFEFEKPKDIGSGDSIFANLSGKLNWIMEITASKEDQSPKVIAIKLESPLSDESSDSALEELQVEIHYKFVKSCECYAASSLDVTIAMSMGEMGDMSMTMDVEFSNIQCAQPLQFLLPELEETAFLPF
ncbi:MAG: hypothetical protein F4W92_09455 [Gammaproteobacteria bacterium]|nr:hypothetical protein [Gammaproteobacteria bacterium]